MTAMATATYEKPELRELPPPGFDPGIDDRCDGQNEGRAVTLEQYLNNTYNPDCDYMDGYLQERNLGVYDHANLQGEILFLFRSRASEWQVKALPELRLQVSATNYRVPDVMVLRSGQQVDRIVREAPLLCIEVLSPEDTFKRLHEKVRDYLAMGVEHIWAFDPESREAFLCDSSGFHLVTEAMLTVPGTPIHLELAAIFPVA
jgi:Uma2 family endonuclease